MGLTFLHKYAKAQPTAMSASDVIAKYVPETNKPNNLGICAKYLMAFVMYLSHIMLITTIHLFCMHVNK